MKSTLKLIFGLLFLPAFLNAQVTTSSISGVVKEKSGPLPGSNIVAIHKPTGTVYGIMSTEKGYYHIGNLHPGGPYKITVSMVGFSAQVKDSIYLTLGEDQVFNFELQTQVNELNGVVVSANRLEAVSSGSVRTTFDESKIAGLPSLNRRLQDITRLTPQSNNNSFMGTNFRYNNVTIDGAINNDAIGFSPSLGGQSNSSGMIGSSTRTNAISLDALQEVQVYLAPYDVKVGNFLGGSVNAISRSGTNKVEGSVYSFGRNASLVGPNNAGDKSKLPSSFEDYQLGFRLGLPIVKDKLFFFTNMEMAHRTDPVIFAAGSPEIGAVISAQQAIDIANYTKTNYGYDPLTADQTSIYSSSKRFFNRIDWNINSKNQLIIRNNTILSEATNLERDQANFRFKGIDFKQVNNSSSTVMELKSQLSNAISNSFIFGYSTVTDKRDPLTDARMPQIQIASGGGTIFLGTDREASIFNFTQNALEITDNLTFLRGKSTFTFGTHNELYKIDYGFVNSWNGRLDYNSVADFLNNRPARVRGSYNYSNNTRDFILSNPPAPFHVNLYSIYGQDDYKVSKNLTITGGIRFDVAELPTKAQLSSKTTSAVVDPNYGNTYNYTLPKDITNKILGQVQISPRLGFNYDILGNKSFIIRGGSGLFTGRIPFAWLGYSFYNNGNTYGAYDQKYTYTGGVPTPAFTGDPSKPSDNGIAAFAAQNGVNVTDQASRTQVDMVDNSFKMPQVWRSSLALDYATDGWKFSVEGIYTQVITDLKFQHVNLYDSPIYYPYDVNKQQPIYITNNPATASTRISNNFTNAYLLSNTDQGFRYSITGQVSKIFNFGFSVIASYTYGESKDIANGIRNSMESNWQLNQALNPNNPGLAYSNFDIRHRIVASLNQKVDWGKKGKYISNFSIFFNAASGLPFTYGFLNATVQNTAQQVSLAYIPNVGETINFFPTTGGTLNGTAGATQQQMADAFDKFIDNNSYLKSRRGTFTERNGGRTPWNTQADFRFNQDFKFKNDRTISFTFDIVNLTNLINSNWGWSYFSPNTFNSTSSIGLRAPSTNGNATTYPKFNSFSDPGTPYAVDLFASRYQMQFGLRFTF